MTIFLNQHVKGNRILLLEDTKNTCASYEHCTKYGEVLKSQAEYRTCKNNNCNESVENRETCCSDPRERCENECCMLLSESEEDNVIWEYKNTVCFTNKGGISPYCTGACEQCFYDKCHPEQKKPKQLQSQPELPPSCESECCKNNIWDFRYKHLEKWTYTKPNACRGENHENFDCAFGCETCLVRNCKYGHVLPTCECDESSIGSDSCLLKKTPCLTLRDLEIVPGVDSLACEIDGIMQVDCNPLPICTCKSMRNENTCYITQFPCQTLNNIKLHNPLTEFWSCYQKGIKTMDCNTMVAPPETPQPTVEPTSEPTVEPSKLCMDDCCRNEPNTKGYQEDLIWTYDGNWQGMQVCRNNRKGAVVCSSRCQSCTRNCMSNSRRRN